MRIVLNGKDHEVPDGADLAGVLAAAGLPERGVAVAVDGEVVPRAAWATTTPADGARVEVLTAVQGG
ncbi:sulfur carrier protein ThiS [Pseudonocardia sp. HH130630-07]|uniref:sulfur carrier protein ThiS n=1 Tax=Pseudonocardia sp. HH130630-07 TaxID=1690815 RepID=UPI0008151B8C|nr:sulfur carrier protein ThiS [Pseudonocardia sp. HH130630-07]ANY07115.1 thiamine biosynthesis protein ThiS [Pseudonocardia sp. HH130630-07]